MPWFCSWSHNSSKALFFCFVYYSQQEQRQREKIIFHMGTLKKAKHYMESSSAFFPGNLNSLCTGSPGKQRRAPQPTPPMLLLLDMNLLKGHRAHHTAYSSSAAPGQSPPASCMSRSRSDLFPLPCNATVKAVSACACSKHLPLAPLHSCCMSRGIVLAPHAHVTVFPGW